MSPNGHSGADFDGRPDVVLSCCGRLNCAAVRMVVEVKRRILSEDGVAQQGIISYTAIKFPPYTISKHLC
jgi:hypothetical protein